MNEENNFENFSNQTNTDINNSLNSENNIGNIGKKKNKNVIVLLITIIVGLLIILSTFYYFNVFTRADQLYKRIMGAGISEISEVILDTEYKTIDTELTLDVNVDLEDELLTTEVKDIIDLINKLKIGFGVEYDSENKKAVVDVEADYDKDELIDLQLYADVKNEKAYMHLGDLLDKYIELEPEDFELDLSFETEELKLTEGQKASIKKFVKELKKELLKTVNKEYCFNEKEKIEINGKTVKVTKNTFKITYAQFMSDMLQQLKSIKSNEKMLDCLNESGKEQFVDAIEAMIEEIEDFDYSDYEDIVFEYNIYTKGILMNDIVKFDVNIAQDNKQMKILEVEKISNNECSYSIPVDDSVKVYGKIYTNGEENEFNINIDVKEMGVITLDLGYKFKCNGGITNVDVSKAIKFEDLTQEDQTTLMTNLQNSKLYSIITDLSSGILGNLIGNENIIGGNTNNDIIIDNTTNNNLLDDSSKIELTTFDGKTKIETAIPQGYILDIDFGSNSSKYIEKEGVDIWISIYYGNINDLYGNLKSSRDTYLGDSFYKNVNLSEMKSTTINNKVFNYATFEYEYGSYGKKDSNMYIWLKISNDYVLKLQITGADKVTKEEITTLLSSIEVK